MKTLLVIDELGMLLGSKNRWVKKGLSFYTRYLARRIDETVSSFSREELLIVGPKEVLNQSQEAKARQHVSYDEVIDQIDWRKAGNIASYLAKQIDTSDAIRKNFTDLFEDKISIPKTAYVRLSHLFCYDAVSHSLLVEHLIAAHHIGRVVVLGGKSEIEKIAQNVAASHRIATQILSPNDLIQGAKEQFVSFLYERDRKLHAEEEIKHRVGEKVPRFKKELIAFVPAHSLHFKTLIPLVAAIEQTGLFECVVFLSHSLLEFRSVLEQEHIASCSLDTFSHRANEREFVQFQNLVIRSFSNTSIKEAFEKMLTYERVNWYSVLNKKLQTFFRWSFSEIEILKKRFSRAFQTLKPKAIFVFSDARLYESSAAAVGKEMKIPVFFYSPNPIMALDEINHYDTGDFLLLGGPYIKEKIITNRYVDSSAVEVVGDIRFDQINEWKDSARTRKTCEMLGVGESKKMFLLISWYTNLKFTLEEKTFFFKTVWEGFRDTKDAVLVIKAHPNESESELKAFARNLGMNVSIVKEIPLYELLAASSGIITTASMTSLEAMMFDVPVLVIDLPKRDYDYYIPLKKGGGALSFKNSIELSHLINELCSNPDFFSKQVGKGRAFIARYIAKPNKGSAKRIMEILTHRVASKKNQKVVAIIQARVSSSRLPNKVLTQLSGQTVLEHVIERVKHAARVDEVVVATSVEASDNRIEELCRKKGISCFRGSLENVLERYVQASRKFGADIVVRVTADSPLVEPRWIDQAILFLQNGNVDYSNAKLPEEFPVGMGCEVITKEALEESLANAKMKEDFEHVTWHCLSHRNQFKIHFLSNPEKEANMNVRLALDEPNDLKLLVEIFKRLYSKNKNLGYAEIVKLYRSSPELFEMNQSVKEKPNLYVRTLGNQ